MSTIKVADKPTLDIVNTNVSSVVNKLPSSNIADKSTLDTINSNVTYIKNNLPSGGGGGYALKCIEVGNLGASTSKTFISTTGGVLYLNPGQLTSQGYITQMYIDGQRMNGVSQCCLFATGFSTMGVHYDYQVLQIPFRNSLQIDTGTYGNLCDYALFKYNAI